jgi:hypothetical protein
MEKYLIILLGAVFMEVLARFIGIDVLANHVQILSVSPVFWVMYRVEKLHHLHKKHNKENN